jgi:anti-sigma regulatory factor (Ser/Thr protein kinase)
VVAALPGSRSAYIDMLQAGWERSVRLAVPSVPEGRLFDLLVCLREVVLNALVHGCAVSPGAEATLRICVASDHSRLMAVVEDPGPGYAFDWRAHNERSGEDLLTEQRGLAMVHGLADSVVIGRRGARVEMTFSLGPVLPTNVP